MSSCPACGAAIAPGLLTCPGCGRLVHADRLVRIAARAEEHERAGRWGDAVVAWREALVLLPRAAPQADAIGERIEAALRHPQARAAEHGRGGDGAGGLIGLGGVLVAGLLKLPVVLGVVASFGVFWSAYGWKLALGVLVLLYVHELGHAVAMALRGMRVTAPMFVPGFGAYVRMQDLPASRVEENRIGLAGPVAGLVSCAVTWVAGVLLHAPVLGAVASLSAVINALNLCPFWQLDGARGFRSLTRPQRALASAACVAAALLAKHPAFWLPAIISSVVTISGAPSPKPDRAGLALFVVLIGALTAVASVAAP